MVFFLRFDCRRNISSSGNRCLVDLVFVFLVFLGCFGFFLI